MTFSVGGMFEQLINPESTSEKRNSNKKKIRQRRIPKHLFSFSKKIRQELQKRSIVDLTEKLWDEHMRGEIDLSVPYCFGRDREILQIGVLTSTVEKPGNVIVSGPTGVGKSVLVYEIARQILCSDGGHILSGQHILLMSTPQKNEHSVHKNVISYLAKHVGKKAILVFDESHRSLTSEHATFNSVRDVFALEFDPLAERCKTLLAENTLSTLSLTDRIGSFLENDPARKRRFSLIEMEELSVDATIDIIMKKGFQEKISKNCERAISIPKETLRIGTYLSLAYYQELFLPAKAYFILDPAVNWYLKTHPECSEVPPEAMIEYMVKVEGKKEEEVREEVEQIEDLVSSPIPLQEPLAKYSINLTSLARRGNLGPAWGRESLTENIASILGQEEYNNVLLTSPPGCGKTRFAEGLAYQIIHDKMFPLQGKEVLLLNWQLAKNNLPALLKSARKYQGQFILIIDEAHRLAGSSNFNLDQFDVANIGQMFSNPMGAITNGMPQMVGGSSSDTLNELKEAMGRGLLPSLLLTTDREAEPLLCDEAFLRRIELRKLDHMTKEQIEYILEMEGSILAKRYCIQDLEIESAAVEVMYYLSKIYFSKEYQPSASFKVFHSVCGFARQYGYSNLDEEVVFLAVAERLQIDREEVEERFFLEKAADHPASRRIPSDEPLMRFSDDWTKEMRMNFSAPFTGHEEIFLHMQAVLSRATCNNVLLIGDAGTGKTTLVQRLAQLMSSEDERHIPRALRDKPLLSLRLSELREGKRAFAEFITSAKKYGGEYVLFIDEIHLLMGGGSAPNPIGDIMGSIAPGLSFSKEFEELKPLLADGTITLIGATTPEDINNMSFTGAIRRRFTMIEVLPPSQREAVHMLNNTIEHLQEQMSKRLDQEVVYEKEAILTAISLADKKQLPASAIAILEMGAVKVQSSLEEHEVIVVQSADLEIEEETNFDYDKDQRVKNTGSVLSLIKYFVGGSKPLKSSRKKRGFFSSIGFKISSFFSWIYLKVTT